MEKSELLTPFQLSVRNFGIKKDFRTLFKILRGIAHTKNINSHHRASIMQNYKRGKNDKIAEKTKPNEYLIRNNYSQA